MPKISKRDKFKGTPAWKMRKLQAQSTENADESREVLGQQYK